MPHTQTGHSNPVEWMEWMKRCVTSINLVSPVKKQTSTKITTGQNGKCYNRAVIGAPKHRIILKMLGHFLQKEMVPTLGLREAPQEDMCRVNKQRKNKQEGHQSNKQRKGVREQHMRKEQSSSPREDKRSVYLHPCLCPSMCMCDHVWGTKKCVAEYQLRKLIKHEEGKS